VNTLVRAALAGAGCALAGGCVVGPNFQPSTAPAADRYTREPLPARASAGQRFEPGAPVAERWWTLFGSARLDALEDEALTANPDLASARAALRQAREAWLAQRAARFPTATLTANAQRAKNSVTIAPPLANNAEVYSLFAAGLNISYVFDVFGGVRRQTEAAAAQADNQRFLAEGVYLTLTTNVANAAIQLASLDAQMDDTARIIAAAHAALDIIRAQQKLGEASTADVAAAESALEQAEQLAPPLQKQIDQQRDLLAALTGRPPSAAPADRFELADLQLPPTLPVSLPAALVRQRPDVQAADANVHVASAEVGVAVAARLPSFSLTVAPGGASSDLATLFANGNALWSVAGGVTAPVFDAGALRHKQKAAEAALDQAKDQYRSAVLAALQNVADVLHAVLNDAEALNHATAAEASAAKSLSLARSQQQHGQVGVLTVLAAEGAWRQAEVALSQARAARYADTVALYQALGGGWRDSLRFE
jgi:NodT family efflux transporter outer membrane factor (OMF) lipoprotein